MKFISVPPDTFIYPLPAVLVSCGTAELPNLITIAWTGTVCSSPPCCYVSIRKERFSHSLIARSGEFVINLMPDSLVEQVDYCGTTSGRNTNKFLNTGLTPRSASAVGVPFVAEALVVIECKVRQILELGSHDMFLADVVAVQVSDQLTDETTQHPDLLKGNLLGYTKGWYHKTGERLLRYGHNKLNRKTV